MMTKPNPGKTWNYDYSRMRVLACLAVIVLHTFNYSLLGAGKFGYALSAAGSFWGHFFEYVNLWAVPLFLMVTGALLLDPAHEVTTGKIFRKYIGRVGSALLLFGLVFILLDMAMGDLPVSAAGFGRGLVDLLTGHSWSHMWYLYLLIGLYLLLPFFRKIAAGCSTGEMRYLLVLLLVFQSLLPILGIWGIETDYRFSVATIYPFYLFLGYAVKSGQVRAPKWCAGVTLAVSVAALVCVTLWGPDSVVDYFASYNSILVVTMAWSVFVVLRHVSTQKVLAVQELSGSAGAEGAQTALTGTAPSRAPKSSMSEQNSKSADRCSALSRAPRTTFGWAALRSFDACSFGIYLIQMIFIKLLVRVWQVNAFASPWLFPVMTVGIALVSWGVTWLLRLIPGVKKVL